MHRSLGSLHSGAGSAEGVRIAGWLTAWPDETEILMAHALGRMSGRSFTSPEERLRSG
jgi:hypothetical protein